MTQYMTTSPNIQMYQRTSMEISNRKLLDWSSAADKRRQLLEIRLSGNYSITNFLRDNCFVLTYTALFMWKSQPPSRTWRTYIRGKQVDFESVRVPGRTYMATFISEKLDFWYTLYMTPFYKCMLWCEFEGHVYTIYYNLFPAVFYTIYFIEEW